MNRRTIKPTPFGPVVVIWTDFEVGPRVVRVLLSRPGVTAEAQAAREYPDARAASGTEIEAVVAAIAGFLEGEDRSISLDVAAMDLCSPFQRSVLRAEHRIPRARVSTYGLIAAHLGDVNGARAVGNALATNPFPLIVPCHRAIRSDRHPGGYQGGVAMKQALLAREGIHFDAYGRVDCPRLHYGGKVSSRRVRGGP